MATANDTGVQLHQFATASLEVDLHGESMKIDIETDYPWDGQVTLRVKESPPAPWTLSLRMPNWCRRYSLSLNGSEIAPHLDESGYLVVERNWQVEDVLLLVMHMEPEFISPNPRIDALRGCVALQRGPLVYCLESHDQPEDIDLLDVQVITSEPLAATAVDILGGIVSVDVPGRVTTSAWEGSLYLPLNDFPQTAPRAVQLTAIPYFIWGNRGMQSMRVWVPRATQGE